MAHVLECLRNGLPLNPVPDLQDLDLSVPHAPKRLTGLTRKEEALAIENALRYIPAVYQPLLAKDFADELHKFGHIYAYRFRPKFPMRAYPIELYPAKCHQSAAIMLMICNNLDPQVAQFPHELVTYGGNGQVFSNWIQFWLVMQYLANMDEQQTLVMYSGHPLGLFPSHLDAPRAVITNGMVIPNYSSREQYNRMFALGVTLYGQMTAGSYCYIGPQGIVHGTTIVLKNAGRKYLQTENLRGKVFVTSGLGGMSGAQPKAAVINGCIGVIAEVNLEALEKRYKQGWLLQKTNDLDELISMIRTARQEGAATSIGYHGNIVDLWNKLANIYTTTGELLVDLGSDQTSCHNLYNGGYYPVGLSFDEANKCMVEEAEVFKEHVRRSLQKHVRAINTLTAAGMSFWDYGNAFMLEAGRAGADIFHPENKTSYRYPTYMQDIMGDIFSMGFGPFRWVCTSGDPNDLAITDSIAEKVLDASISSLSVQPGLRSVVQQYEDNLDWIKNAASYHLVVGSQSRILYCDQQGRVDLALGINKCIAEGSIKAPVVLSRDHHDVSGTDSPFRETSNIYDGSAFCADMAVQNALGDSFRGATWVSLHNGGGVGWGEVMNGGFGLVLDGSEDAARRARTMLAWDVSNGVTRRAWCGNEHAINTIKRTMECSSGLVVTVPNAVPDHSLAARALEGGV